MLKYIQSFFSHCSSYFNANSSQDSNTNNQLILYKKEIGCFIADFTAVSELSKLLFLIIESNVRKDNAYTEMIFTLSLGITSVVTLFITVLALLNQLSSQPNTSTCQTPELSESYFYTILYIILNNILIQAMWINAFYVIRPHKQDLANNRKNSSILIFLALSIISLLLVGITLDFAINNSLLDVFALTLLATMVLNITCEYYIQHYPINHFIKNVLSLKKKHEEYKNRSDLAINLAKIIASYLPAAQPEILLSQLSEQFSSYSLAQLTKQNKRIIGFDWNKLCKSKSPIDKNLFDINHLYNDQDSYYYCK